MSGPTGTRPKGSCPRGLLLVGAIICASTWLFMLLVAFETLCAGSDSTASFVALPKRAVDIVRGRRALAGPLTTNDKQSMVALAQHIMELRAAGDGLDEELSEAAYRLAHAIVTARNADAASNMAERQKPAMRGGQLRDDDRKSASVDDRTASDVAAGRPTAADGIQAPASVDETLMYTQQTCYIGPNEHELCVFTGPLCFDGQGPIVFLPEPIRDKNYTDDYTTVCVDPRYYEPSSLEDGGCSLAGAGKRSSYDTSQPMDPQTGFAMGLSYRRWGAQGRHGGLIFRELKPEEVAGPHPKQVLSAHGGVDAQGRPTGAGRWGSTKARRSSSSGSGADGQLPGVEVLSDGPFDHEAAPGLRVQRRTSTADGTVVDWLEAPLWLGGLDGQWSTNPFHWWSRVGALYNARRSNATTDFLRHPADGYIQPVVGHEIPGRMSIYRQPDEVRAPAEGFSTANRASWRVGAQWGPLPRMDAVVFTGDGAKAIESLESLGDWFKSTLTLAAPPGATFTFSKLLKSLGQKKMICSASGGVIPGSVPKWFTGRGDAWMWRQYAYQSTGLSAAGVLPHPRFPPRKITFVDRKGMNGRGVYNRDEVLELLHGTGLAVDFVGNMGSMSFKEQVSLMAGTGILVAPHGAALANAMFLPAHSVVVEMFPYGMKKHTYRALAAHSDLTYFPLYSWELLPPNRTEFYGVALMNEEYYWNKCAAVNMSSIDALNEHACNAASKNYPIVVPLEQLRQVLRDAVDIIAAYSLANPAWEAIARKAGITPAPAPPHVKETVHGMGKAK